MESLETYWRDGFPSVEGWVDTPLLPFVQAVGECCPFRLLSVGGCATTGRPLLSDHP